jgi:hypothetical protein
LTDHEEDQAEIAGLRVQIHELRRENDLLRQSHIDLVAELAEQRAAAWAEHLAAQLAGRGMSSAADDRLAD